MEILVDTSVWIDYFRSGEQTEKLDTLIDKNLVVTNDLILAELLPLIMIRKEEKPIHLLKKLKNNTIRLDWKEIVYFQVMCLKSGSSGIGIPDLVIAQNGIQNNTPIYSIDKHFKFIYEANISIKIYL